MKVDKKNGFVRLYRDDSLIATFTENEATETLEKLKRELE